MDLENRALTFAAAAHAAINQKRKSTGAPYIVHPVRVANTVRSIGGTPEQIAAALLHDTVEDVTLAGLKEAAARVGTYDVADLVETDDLRANRTVRLKVIEIVFGPVVTALVEMLTDVSIKTDGNRKVRKGLDREHSATASTEAQTIKLADLLDNSSDITSEDPNFAHVWMREMQKMLTVLDKGDPTLLERAQATCDTYFENENLDAKTP